jgi:sulfonate transport system permease protein
MLTRLNDAVRRHPLGFATFLTIIVAWEVAAHLAPKSGLAGSPLVPSWEFVFGDSLKGLSDYWTIDFLAPRPSFGGEQTWLGAFAAITYHSGVTLTRLLLGLTLGLVIGLGIGLAVSYSNFIRRLSWTPLNFLRMVPALASIPLFQFWFGANFLGTTVFIAYGTVVLLVVATMNAVANVPDLFIESARTLGASRLRTYLNVVIPATLPELRTALLLAAGLSWSLEIGAEYLGLNEGLGAILVTAEFFTNTGRMVIVAILVIIYALISFAILDRIAARALRWMPTLQGKTVTSGENAKHRRALG